ncbi:MAG TPA: PEGA domain-containing protein [Kofleriaceae bacterium]|nr:PEGA domain-containing protein [Kofleriaceae bacterium]
MRALVVALFMLFAAPARAGTVGIVVTGDQGLQAELSKQLDNWLRGHGHQVADALGADGTRSLLNCMEIDDQGCAQGVVAARAKTEAVLYGQAAKSRTSKATILTIYWLYKDKEPVGMRRACEDCTADVMRGIVDEMLGLVTQVSSEKRGRVALHSKPEGMQVLIDNENIGVTPMERDLAVGTHQIVLMHRGQRVGERSLKVQPDVSAEITIPVTMPVDDEPEGRRSRPSRVVPALVLGLGVAAIAGGAVLYVTSEEDTGEKLYYRDTKLAGIGVAAGGVVVTALGTWLWVRAGGPADSAPVATLDAHGGTIGWSRAF